MLSALEELGGGRAEDSRDILSFSFSREGNKIIRDKKLGCGQQTYWLLSFPESSPSVQSNHKLLTSRTSGSPLVLLSLNLFVELILVCRLFVESHINP